MRRCRAAGLLAAVIVAGAALPVCAGRPPPPISATAAVLIEWHSATVLWERSGLAPRHPASLTKVVTAVVAARAGELGDVVQVSPRAAAVPGSTMGLASGERYTLENLIWALLLASANDAGIAIAEHVGGSLEGFAALMNATSRQLGAWSSSFANPHGLTQCGHYASPFDLALFSRELLSHPWLGRVVAAKTAVVRRETPPGQLALANTNRLLTSFYGADGVKTGTTAAAGACLIASASRGKLRLIAVVMDSRDRYADARALLEYGFSHFRLAWGGRAGQVVRTVPVSGGTPALLPLVLAADLVGVVKAGEGEWWVEIDYEDQVAAPVSPGTPLGTASLRTHHRLVARVPITAQCEVLRITWWRRWRAAWHRVMREVMAGPGP